GNNKKRERTVNRGETLCLCHACWIRQRRFKECIVNQAQKFSDVWQAPVRLMRSFVTGVATVVAIHCARCIEVGDVIKSLLPGPGSSRTVGSFQPDQPR